MSFHSPYIIYFALKRSLTQILLPGSSPINPYTLALSSALVLHYVGTGILGLSSDFALRYCKKSNILCQCKMKQLH